MVCAHPEFSSRELRISHPARALGPFCGGRCDRPNPEPHGASVNSVRENTADLLLRISNGL